MKLTLVCRDSRMILQSAFVIVASIDIYIYTYIVSRVHTSYQALPYSLALFIVPFHFLTHELLLFATSVWTTNIHDCLHGRCEPIMGAGYHTIHHTDYKTNYGHYFTYMDALFGTLLPPDEYTEMLASKKKAKEEAAAAKVKSS